MKNKSIEMTSFIHHRHRHTFFIDYEIKLKKIQFFTEFLQIFTLLCFSP